MTESKKIIALEKVVIKFAGDSGDGMQLTGTQFSDTTALFGNEIATFPDYPSEIRAPQGTISGVSGFQVHFGKSGIHSPGDAADILVAMNPAALKANLKNLQSKATILIDQDAFDAKGLEKAGYTIHPGQDGSLDEYQVIEVPITQLTKKAITDKALKLDNKSMLRCKNMFSLGMVYCMFNREMDKTRQYIQEKFGKKPEVRDANIAALEAGYALAENMEAIAHAFTVEPAPHLHGRYRNLTGNQAIAWGLMLAAHNAKRPLFLGSYPITPATDIMQELARYPELGVKVFQAEDEIAGICSAIGAAYAGNLAVTSTSGPGFALKTEAIGLAIMAEIPLVIVNVQRGGPSTGLPTKTEQSDLLQALVGRNGESPAVVLASGSPADCLEMAYQASKIAIEHVTPVILLSDGYLGNGAEAWKIKGPQEFSPIAVPIPTSKPENWQPYQRHPETLTRVWAIPGIKGMEHRIGGLEKENNSGAVSHDPDNHEKMVHLRAAKIDKIKSFIPPQKLKGKKANDLLVIGWGGTFGTLFGAVQELQEEGCNIGMAHFQYINPLPANTHDILRQFRRIVVCELNSGQFAKWLKMQFPMREYLQINKIKGQPFTIAELKQSIKHLYDNAHGN